MDREPGCTCGIYGPCIAHIRSLLMNRDGEGRYAIYTPATVPLVERPEPQSFRGTAGFSRRSFGERARTVGVRLAILWLRMFRVEGLMWRMHLRINGRIEVGGSNIYACENRIEWTE